jgi:hypothetical protein
MIKTAREMKAWWTLRSMIVLIMGLLGAVCRGVYRSELSTEMLA